MKYQIKLLRGLDQSNYILMFLQGSMDIVSLGRVFDKLLEATQSLPDCKILIDCQDCKCQVAPSELKQIERTLDLASWPAANKIAFVSSPDQGRFQELMSLSDYLLKQKVDVRVFYEMRNAINWLARDGA